MGIEQRDYYRESRDSGAIDWGFGPITPTVQWLLFANIAIFIGQLLFTKSDAPQELIRKLHREAQSSRESTPPADKTSPSDNGAKAEPPADDDLPPILSPEQQLLVEEMLSRQYFWPTTSVVQEWLEVDTAKILQGQVWRLLTGAFCHSRFGIWHIVLNMMALIWFGVALEEIYGQREFLWFYLGGCLTASVAHVLLDLITGQRIPAIGASGGVMAVLVLFAIHFPRQIVYLFWMIPVEMRVLVILYLIYDLHPVLLSLGGNGYSDGVGHAAHLGGMAFGYLYYRRGLRLDPLLSRFSLQPLRQSPSRPRREEVVSVPNRTDPPTAELDAVLAKLSLSGRESLTEQEMAILKAASTWLRLGKFREPE